MNAKNINDNNFFLFYSIKNKQTCVGTIEHSFNAIR